jgi:hypothetical protein
MGEICASGSVGGEGGNILAYPASWQTSRCHRKATKGWAVWHLARTAGKPTRSQKKQVTITDGEKGAPELHVIRIERSEAKCN